MRTPGQKSLPDLTRGLAIKDIAPGQLITGRVGEDEVVLTRVGEEFYAVRAHCTHYRGPLGEGLVLGHTVRCPLHHACFDLRTGEAVRAPALDPLPRWRVDRTGDTVFVREKLAASPPETRPRQGPDSVVIIGGGAAGLAAADMLRREGFAGSVAIISADQDPPCDRPNLSKDYLAGEAQEDWIPLEPDSFYSDQRIDLQLKTRVTAIEPRAHTVALAGGGSLSYGALLIATGAEPVRLTVAGAATPEVHYLRSFADSRAIVPKATAGARAVVVGASFIGLEVAASLVARKVHVDVVAPGSHPLGKVLGPTLGAHVRRLHEKHGVTFHLGQRVAKIDPGKVMLSSGRALKADFVIVGIGVRPVVELAEKAGLSVDGGIVVSEYLETSARDIFAAGDVTRWRDPLTGERRHAEHWVVAERQGQVAAKNILGRREAFASAPFFWSQHYDTTIRYVGYGDGWDQVVVDGDPATGCRASFRKAGREVAVATIGRDLEALEAEAAFETAAPPFRPSAA